MTKTYKAKTEVSFNVSVDGAWVHVSFVPLTLGGSYFTTDDVRLQAAIEHHHFYGRLLSLESTAKTPPPPSTQETDPPTSSPPQPLSFGSLADAKEWIATEYGVSRTLLRTRAQMEAVALDHGRILIIENPSNLPHYDYLERP